MIFTLILSSLFFFYDTTLPENEKYFGYISSVVISSGIVFNMPIIVICGTIVKLNLSYSVITFINRKRARLLDLDENDV